MIPQQGQVQPQAQEEKFTIDTAKRMNDGVVTETNAQISGTPGGLASEPAAQQQQGLGSVPGQQNRFDESAIMAVQNGEVDPQQVLSDPRVSDSAKARLQSLA